MSKTKKDKANYYIHHIKYDNVGNLLAHKRKINQDDVPKELKSMIEKLSYDYNTGLRHGNDRKAYSEMKITERKIKRAKENSQLKKELKQF